MEVCLDERANSYVRYFRRVGFLRPLAISVGPRSTKKMVQSEVSNDDDYEDYSLYTDEDYAELEQAFEFTF